MKNQEMNSMHLLNSRSYVGMGSQMEYSHSQQMQQARRQNPGQQHHSMAAQVFQYPDSQQQYEGPYAVSSSQMKQYQA